VGEYFLEFCRAKIDFFDSKLLFFIRERIDIFKNLEISTDEEKLKIVHQKVRKANESRDYHFPIEKNWFLDFIDFDISCKKCTFLQKLPANFPLSFLESIDSSIYHILQSRFLISLQIGLFKKEQKREIVDNNRWQSLVQDRILQAQKLNLPRRFTLILMEKIHKYSVELQKHNG
jgi:chorismate mutase